MRKFIIKYAIGQELLKKEWEVIADCEIFALLQFINASVRNTCQDFTQIWDISIEEK